MSRSRQVPSRRARRRRGAIFVTALAVIVILCALVLVFAQDVRVASIESGNRLSAARAEAIERGAEQWVLAQVESHRPDAVAIERVAAEGLRVGEGYFWVIRRDPLQDRTIGFGIADESAKLNLNVATAEQLGALPGLPDPTVADSIAAWRASASSGSRASDGYYQTLAEPYRRKGAPFETVEELLLVKGVTPQLLFGDDANRNGVIDPVEARAGAARAIVTGAGDGAGARRGVFDDLTCYTVEPNVAADGSPRVDVNERDTAALGAVLSGALPADRANAVRGRVDSFMAAAPQDEPFFDNLGAFYVASTMTAEEFALVADRLTTTPRRSLPGLINVNTAPAAVLACLPGLTRADADALVAQRAVSANPGSIAWIFFALPPEKARAVADLLTARSFQYSADVVALAGDGRAFKRARIVVDARRMPARVVYRKDLTALGWPLPAAVRAAVRAGRGLPARVQGAPGGAVAATP